MAAGRARAATRRTGLPGGVPRDPAREQAPHLIKAFEEGLRSLGYRVGDNVAIEYRFANGELERLPALAAELVRLGVDVIVAVSNPSIVAAMKATTTIPIVMIGGVDPVSTGLVASLARPGGNVTGLTPDTGSEILGKRFELLKEILPNLSRVGILFNPDVAFNRSRQTSMTETARTLGLTTIPVEARGLDALEQAFAMMVRERAQAFVMQGDSVLYNNRGQIVEMALRNRLPAASLQKEYADAGFLLTYGADIPRSISSCCGLRRQDLQGCEACRTAGRAADQVRAGDQFEDRKSARHHHATDAASSRRRGDRIGLSFAAVHESRKWH